MTCHLGPGLDPSPRIDLFDWEDIASSVLTRVFAARSNPGFIEARDPINRISIHWVGIAAWMTTSQGLVREPRGTPVFIHCCSGGSSSCDSHASSHTPHRDRSLPRSEPYRTCPSYGMTHRRTSVISLIMALISSSSRSIRARRIR